MSTSETNRSEFIESLIMHTALKYAIRQRVFSNDQGTRRHAERLLRSMQDGKKTFGRQLRMVGLMQKGITLPALQKSLNCSRRTVFRYLNDLERSGVDVELQDNKYFVKTALPKEWFAGT